MNLKDTRKMIRKGRFIEGIYNYCDRWCERCLFTARCLLYAQDRAEAEPATDLDDESFSKNLESRLKDTMEMIMESARERGIDPEELTQAAAQEPERIKLGPEDHPLSRSGVEYAGIAKSWFNDEPGATGPQFEPTEPSNDVEAAVEVIHWFQYQIPVKLTCALNARLDEEDDEVPGGQRYSDGCAKVALIGIDRSIAAWGVLLDHFAAKSDSIRSILDRLDALRLKTVEAFPQARSFLRPGFDFMPTVQ